MFSPLLPLPLPPLHMNECPSTHTHQNVNLFCFLFLLCPFFKWQKGVSGRDVGSDVKPGWRGDLLGQPFPPPFLLPVHFQTCSLHVGARGMGKTTVCPLLLCSLPLPNSVVDDVFWYHGDHPLYPLSSISSPNCFPSQPGGSPPPPPQPLLCTLLKVQAHLKVCT